MVQINFAQRTVNAKIVYYGPGMSGKTTNLEVIHQRAPSSNRGDLTSISTDGDRTLFFDFMPLDLGTVAGMRTCFQIYTVPGQVYYNSTRKLVLQGVDGVVFVADSSAAMQDENLESLRNLQENLAEYGRSLEELPLVIQYNKRDLPDALPLEELEALLNPGGAPSFEAVANTGQGVFPTLKALAACVLEHIHKVQQSGTAGGSSSHEPPPRVAQTGFHAPPVTAAQRTPATLEPPAPFAGAAPAEAASSASGLELAAAASVPPAAAAQPSVDPGSLRLSRPMGRAPEHQLGAQRPPVPAAQPSKPRAQAQPAPGATRAAAPGAQRPAPAGAPQARPQPQPQGRPQGRPLRAQPEAAAAPRPAARARAQAGTAPQGAPAQVLATPVARSGGKKNVVMTTLIVVGSVIVGAVIGSFMLSLL